MSSKYGRKTAFTSNKKNVTEACKPQPKPKEKEPLTITKGISTGIGLFVTAVIITLGIYYLVIKNSDVLWMAQNKSFFTTNQVFLNECMHRPGGFIAWMASYLTQFFYYPWVGACIMVAIWVASLWLSKLAFGVRAAWISVLAIPIAALLVSMIDTGYWIYYLKQTGYWFYGTVGYFCAMVLVLFHSRLPKCSDRIITIVLVALTYPFFGWYTLLALIYIAVRAVVKTRVGCTPLKRIVYPTLPLLLVCALPVLCIRLYPEMQLEDAWVAGFPYFVCDDIISYVPEIPFMVMGATPLLFPLIPKRYPLRGGIAWMVLFTTTCLTVASWMWVEKSDFQNYNYHAELRMYRSADSQNWDEVLDEMSDIPGNASRQMVLMKNIALLNKGELGTKMFKYNNMGEDPKNGFDTLHVHMVQAAGPLIYYHHGKTNFALRWCIENSVEFGYSFDNLKMLTRCALVNGEMEAAKRYLDILATSTFHHAWAERLLPITKKPTLIKNYHEFDSVRELYSHMGSTLDGDNGLVEMYLLNYFSNTMNRDSKLLQEMTLVYALVNKDIQLFWPRFFLYAKLHKGDVMPIHYQEAAYLYGLLEPDNVDISDMPFDETMKERYEGFQHETQSLLATGMSTEEVGEATKSTYGGTFWWFYFFSRNIRSY